MLGNDMLLPLMSSETLSGGDEFVAWTGRDIVAAQGRRPKPEIDRASRWLRCHDVYRQNSPQRASMSTRVIAPRCSSQRANASVAIERSDRSEIARLDLVGDLRKIHILIRRRELWPYDHNMTRR
jgi:hypothetical protein